MKGIISDYFYIAGNIYFFQTVKISESPIHSAALQFLYTVRNYNASYLIGNIITHPRSQYPNRIPVNFTGNYKVLLASQILRYRQCIMIYPIFIKSILRCSGSNSLCLFIGFLRLLYLYLFPDFCSNQKNTGCRQHKRCQLCHPRTCFCPFFLFSFRLCLRLSFLSGDFFLFLSLLFFFLLLCLLDFPPPFKFRLLNSGLFLLLLLFFQILSITGIDIHIRLTFIKELQGLMICPLINVCNRIRQDKFIPAVSP